MVQSGYVKYKELNVTNHAEKRNETRTMAEVNCNDGYKPETENYTAMCFRGKWVPPVLPNCAGIF